MIVSARDGTSKDNATLITDKENELLHAQKSDSRQDIANTYVSEMVESKKQKIKEDREETFRKILSLFEQSLLNDLEEIFNQIEEKLDEFKISRNRQNRMSNAESLRDFDTLRLIFINEYGLDADKVNAMSQDELREQRLKFDELEQQKQAVIISEIRDLAQQYKERAKGLGKARPDLEQAELDKLYAIKYKAAAMGLDFENIFDNTIQKGHTDFQSVNNRHGEKDLNSEFNKVAPTERDGKTLFADNDVTVKQDSPNLFN